MKLNNSQKLLRYLLVSTLLFGILGLIIIAKKTTAEKQSIENTSRNIIAVATQSDDKLPPKITNANLGWNKNLLVDDVTYDLYIPHNYDRSYLSESN